jgi:hypothetical protein
MSRSGVRIPSPALGRLTWGNAPEHVVRLRASEIRHFLDNVEEADPSERRDGEETFDGIE